MSTSAGKEMVHIDETSFYQEKFDEYVEKFRDRKLTKRGIIVNPQKPRYVLYARKSTTGKKTQLKSIQDQVKACRELQKKENLQVVNVLREEKSARKSGKRDKFSQMIKGIKAGYYNGILTWHPDRLARNMKEAGELIDLLDKGIIVDLKFPSYTFVNDPNGKMALGIQFVLAKQYSDGLSVSTQRGSGGRVSEGEAIGKPKYGYNIVKGMYCPVTGAFEHWQNAWDLVLEGNTLMEIFNYLRDKGVRSISSHKQLSRFFRDSFYAGCRVFGSKIIWMKDVDVDFIPMVDIKKFMEVRVTLDNKKAFVKTNAKTILFRKMVHCYYCGKLMSPGKSSSKTGKRYFYIRCTNKDCKRDKKGVRGKVLYDFVIKTLSDGFDVNKQLYNQAVKSHEERSVDIEQDLNNSIRILGKKRRTLEKERSGLSKSLADDIDPAVEESISGEIGRLTVKMNGIDEDIGAKEKEKIGLAVKIKQEIPSYDDFLNFFKNVDAVIKSTRDRYLLDKIVRLVFLNFTLGDEEVVSYKLKEPFASYVKVGSVSSGVEDGI